MAAGKDKHRDTKKKSVSFVNIEGLPNQVPIPNADCGILVHVKGDGKLCIRSSSLEGENDVDIDILLHIRNQSRPITLLLPQEQTKTSLEINGDGDMQFSIKDAKDGNKSNEGLNDLNIDNHGFTDCSKEHPKKTHRRNNSDFLHISGKDLNIPELELEEESSAVETKDCGTDVCSIDILLSDDTADNNVLSTICYKCGGGNNQCMCELCEQKLSLENRSNSEVTGTDTVQIQSLVDSVLRYGKFDPEDAENSHSDTCLKVLETKWGESNVSCLKDSIRKSYTYLLDVLDLLDLCDHLYENCVLEIDIYQKLFDMCYEPRYVRSAKRTLLLHLSTRSVRQDKMINALYGSAQYQLIPYFYPQVRI